MLYLALLACLPAWSSHHDFYCCLVVPLCGAISSQNYTPNQSFLKKTIYSIFQLQKSEIGRKKLAYKYPRDNFTCPA
jgi:hypothetical protein